MAGTIKGITIEFRGDTTSLDDALRKIKNETKGIDSNLRDVNRGLKFNPSSVELWRQKQTLLTSKLNETNEKVALLKDTLKKVDSGEIELSAEETARLKRELIEAESKAKYFEGELRKIGNVNLRALGEQFKQIGDKMTEVGKNLTTKVTLPLAAVGTVAAKKFAEVDKTMQLTNSTMRNTAEEADLLNKAMKSAAASSTYGMNDAATATLNFARAGLNAKQAASALAPAMALAAGEGGDLDTVSAGLVATINGFHDSFDDAATYADVFANACNNSALDVNSLSKAMSVAAPIFSAAGYNVKDAALYMGVMANNGIEADKAANSLKTGMARLVSPAKEGAAMMEKLGISVTNADGTMKDSVTIQKELHDAFSKLSESEQIAAASAIFGKNQMAPWLALINTAPEDVDALSLALGANGTAMEMQAAMMSGFAGSIEQLKSGLDVLLTSLGEALAPVIQKVVAGLQVLVDWFNNLSPKMQTVIATVGLIVAAIGPLLVILGTLISSIGSIISVIGVVAPLIAGVAAPIAIAIAAIAALIAIGVLLYKNWDIIKAKVLELWKNLVQTWTNIKTSIIATVTQLKTSITTMFNNLKLSIITAINNLKLSLAAAWTSIKTTASTIWTTIKTAVTTAASSIKSSVSGTFNALKGTVSATWNAIKSAITEPINTAVKLVSAGISKLKSIVNGAKLSLPHIKLPHFSVSGKFSLNPPSVPKVSVSWYKTGGIFDSGPQVIGVGEAGPEAVVPLDKLWNKLDAIAVAAASGDSPTIVINAAPGMDINQIATAVEQVLVRREKQRVKAWGY